MRPHKAIKSFSGKNRWLSNFWPAIDGLVGTDQGAMEIEFEGLIYPSVEHAYQAAKTLDLEKRKEVLGFPLAKQAKGWGRTLELRSDWESLKFSVMKVLLRKKFENPELRAKLLATGDVELVEGNRWHDQTYGVCLCPEHKGVGLNVLGTILMEIREEIRGGWAANG